jgi:Tannase and feruloyl esterase
MSWRGRQHGRRHRPAVRSAASATIVAVVCAGLLAAQAANADVSVRAPVEPCAALSALSLPAGGHVTSATDVPPSGGTPAYCSVTIEVIDNSDPRGGLPGDIHIDLTLPAANWNGSYMAEGGGVYCNPATPATDQLAAGYATSTTDCGHQEFLLTSHWVTNPAGGLNWNRINDFGYLAMHLMAVESKTVIEAYYGLAPRYSFWNGCSTGGRQGLSEAERYPTDFNGILAGAPALSWPEFMNAQLWPQLVMRWSNDELPPCKEAAVNAALKSHCRDQNGQIDGVFDPRTCDVRAVLRGLVGTSTPCGRFTATDARVVQAIWQGPRKSGSQADLLHGEPVWFGLEPGADLGSIPGLTLAATTGPDDGIGPQVGAPFIPTVDWYQNWIKQDPAWLWTDETYPQFWQDFETSSSTFDGALATDNPNLRAFRDAGGRIVMWMGLADQLIFTGDSINFYNRVLRAMGGPKTQRFFRFFLAPGVAHCGRPGEGSVAPTNPMQAVIDWVQQGQAPDVLPASGTIDGQAVTRPLCPYPHPDAVYDGGDPNQAGSYSCPRRIQLTNPWVLESGGDR